MATPTLTGRPAPADRPPAARPPTLLADLTALVRPGQWTKNLVVVPLGLLGAPRVDAGAVGGAVAAVGVFTLASALIYLVNDIGDRDRDRRHPEKRHRPIAAGRIGVPTAVSFAAVLAVLLAATVGLTVVTGAASPLDWWPVAAYVALNAAYSKGLKHVPLLDVFIVALGFVLRLAQGCLASGNPVPNWLALCVFSLCLLLILGKRRHEMAVGGVSHRPALRGYTLGFLDQLLAFAAVLTAVSYVLHIQGSPAFGPHGPLVAVLTAPFALFGLARYLQLLVVDAGGGNPSRALFSDRTTVLNALLWSALLAVAWPLSHLGS
ncbi:MULTISPECIES: UbiA prenyltransferase family protein [unclassified Streptomyces]|uniref:UbiA prenyltransferase family protein n=1 Tax=unclassified Streptomyces TaxID=2593676 RepID=UPI0016607FBB|nr:MULTISPECIES: UbiA prenyltransferase family protein [unclassified Streptomyces]MBD0707446.1 prenyltransferase [Streptomyces sp. CBMA291]MBD0715102.1 prenyltransferase [Streptomyces sp. CBMA370]